MVMTNDRSVSPSAVIMDQQKEETNATRKRTFRKLEDLNLIDNFLFQQVLIHEDGEEFARILLSTILDKPIRKVKITPQKNVLGVDTNKHGICLDVYIEDVSEVNPVNYPNAKTPGFTDAENSGIAAGESRGLADAEIIPDVYDIEPNNTYEKESLPKRTRYYHGLIDTQLLSAGFNYSKLPNMFIIMILPYDPFGKNRMVYTVKNSCVEDPGVPYNDGATKIFLYTKGTEGNPSQGLRNMLKYIQESTKENATDKDVIRVQGFVDKVKGRREVGINYMKSWEMEEWIKQQAYKEGHDEGYSVGHDEGRREGHSEGHSKGHREGIEKANRLYATLAEAGRMDDIVKAAGDREYQEKLFREFNL